MSRTYRISSNTPASRWQDGFPSGNGTIGAMAYGGVRRETILINHEALWFPLYEKPASVPNMAEYLPRVREMIAEGRCGEAEEFWNRRLKEHDYGLQRQPFTNPYHPAFDLIIEHTGDGSVCSDGYSRSLDFSTGEVVVEWDADGAVSGRDLFVSRADDIVVTRIRCTRPRSVCCALALAPHDPQREIYSLYMGKTKEYVLERKAYEEEPIVYTVDADEPGIAISARYYNGRAFGGVACVGITGGSAWVDDGRLRVEAADEVVVRLGLFTDVRDTDAAIGELQALVKTLPPDYGTLFASHRKLHQALFFRTRIDLHAGRERNRSNRELLDEAREGRLLPALVERLFDSGRYLLISSSRPGGLPANLQGVWSGTWNPAWASDYTVDENIQMCYWPALPCNMPEVTMPYFDYFDLLVADWRKNALQLYGCRGVVSFMRHSDHGLMLQDAPWQFWTAGAGWLAQLYYDYYQFTGDLGFLSSRAFPLMKQVALFYEDFCTIGPEGTYRFSPSLSPENSPADTKVKTTVNATMDVAVMKEILRHLIDASRILETGDDVSVWERMLEKLPEYRIGPDGALKEWIHPDLPDRHEHRHVSHLYPLYPGYEVDVESGDSMVREGCRRVLELKTGRPAEQYHPWSHAHMANAYARLGDAERALECLRRTVHDFGEHNFLSFDAHHDDVFQLDACCGFTAGVVEMLVISKRGRLLLLPALPREWVKGAVRGILCRGAIELDLQWDFVRKRRIVVSMVARASQSITLCFPMPVEITGSVDSRTAVTTVATDKIRCSLTLPQNRRITLEADIRGS